MPLTTDSRCWPELADQRGVFVPARLIELHHLFVGEHFGKSDDRVERRTQLVAHRGEESALCGVGALGLLARLFDRLPLNLALGHVPDDRDDLSFAALLFVVDRIERATAHLDPDELCGVVGLTRGFTADAELNRAADPARGGIGERSHIGRPVSDMNVVEQPMTEQRLRRRSEQGFRCRRRKPDRAVAAVARDDVGNVAREEAIAVLFHDQQP